MGHNYSVLNFGRGAISIGIKTTVIIGEALVVLNLSQYLCKVSFCNHNPTLPVHKIDLNLLSTGCVTEGNEDMYISNSCVV